MLCFAATASGLSTTFLCVCAYRRGKKKDKYAGIRKASTLYLNLSKRTAWLRPSACWAYQNLSRAHMEPWNGKFPFVMCVRMFCFYYFSFLSSLQLHLGLICTSCIRACFLLSLFFRTDYANQIWTEINIIECIIVDSPSVTPFCRSSSVVYQLRAKFNKASPVMLTF